LWRHNEHLRDLMRNGWPSRRWLIQRPEGREDVRNNTSGQRSADYEATIPQEPLLPPASPPPQPQPAVNLPHPPAVDILHPPPNLHVPPPLPLARQPFNQNWTVHYLGKMDVTCSYCGAFHWRSEKLSTSLANSPKFGGSCLSCCYVESSRTITSSFHHPVIIPSSRSHPIIPSSSRHPVLIPSSSRHPVLAPITSYPILGSGRTESGSYQRSGRNNIQPVDVINICSAFILNASYVFLLLLLSRLFCYDLRPCPPYCFMTSIPR
jgi:hypothetical protein